MLAVNSPNIIDHPVFVTLNFKRKLKCISNTKSVLISWSYRPVNIVTCGIVVLNFKESTLNSSLIPLNSSFGRKT